MAWCRNVCESVFPLEEMRPAVVLRGSIDTDNQVIADDASSSRTFQILTLVDTHGGRKGEETEKRGRLLVRGSQRYATSLCDTDSVVGVRVSVCIARWFEVQ